MRIILLCLKKFRQVLNRLNLKLVIESGLLSKKIFLAKFTPKIDKKEILVIDSVLKTNPWKYKIKHLSGETITGSFYEKELLLSILESYFPEPDILIGDKFKVISDLPSYATKKELIDATSIDTSSLAAKRDFIALKVEVDVLDIRKLTDVPTDLNNIKTKLDDLDVGKLKAVPLGLKKLSDVVSQEIPKTTKFNTLNTNVNSLEKTLLMCIL